MAAGLPTTVQDDSHIAAMIERHFEDHKDYCVVTGSSKSLAAKILNNLINNIEAFQQAKKLKEDLTESEAVTESLAKFASIFKEEGAETQDFNKQGDEVKPAAEDKVSEERTVIQVKMTNAGNKQTSHTTVMQSEILDTDDSRHRDNASLSSVIPVTEGMEFDESLTMQSEVLVTKGVESKESTAMHTGISITETMDIATTTVPAVKHRLSVTSDIETEEIKAVPAGISATEVKKITGTTAETKDSKESTAAVILGCQVKKIWRLQKVQCSLGYQPKMTGGL
ncbi:uncharacterized protein [Ptychodera flava]|uniref:uncharacterized protein n=1 Tax=Ptychodera flava TaxID=63121 RepID=UPI00396A2131